MRRRANVIPDDVCACRCEQTSNGRTHVTVANNGNPNWFWHNSRLACDGEALAVVVVALDFVYERETEVFA